MTGGSPEDSAAAVADLVLASTSPYRRMLLERLGVPFRTIAPEFDESSVSGEGRTPQELAEFLAASKAERVSLREPSCTVIGSDQLVAVAGRILGKPGTVQQAEAQLEAMAGRLHELITAVVVRLGDQVFAHTDVTRMQMRELSRDEIARYVAHDSPLDCAGSYKLEGRGIVLFERIESGDHTAITGLPLIWLTTTLRRLGYAVP
jgi:septum formation protein